MTGKQRLMTQTMTEVKRPKIKGECICIYCNNSCDPDKDEFVVTKRKQLKWFHKRCYYVYNKLGFDLIKEEDNV